MPLAFTVPFNVAELEVMPVADPVVTVGEVNKTTVNVPLDVKA